MKENRNKIILQTLAKRQPDLTVLMDEVHKPHNLAAIVRTCDAVGIGEVHAVYPPGMVKIGHGTAMGSNRWVKTITHKTRQSAISQLQERGMQVLAAHFSSQAVDFRQIDYTRPTAILLGAEKEGVSDEAAGLVDGHIIIPMSGMVQSLNVSVATAIILYEAQRQREEAGLYNGPRIAPEKHAQLRFEWLHPQVSRFCQKHQIRYPQLNEQGDICDPEWDELRRRITA